MLVVLHVSAPYSSTDFMLELNRCIFVCNDNAMELQMFLSCTNAPLAWPVLALTSASVPPCLSMMLPRYVKVCTISILLTDSTLAAHTLIICSCLYVHLGPSSPHLLMAVRQQCRIIGKIQIFDLRLECPLDSISLSTSS